MFPHLFFHTSYLFNDPCSRSAAFRPLAMYTRRIRRAIPAKKSLGGRQVVTWAFHLGAPYSWPGLLLRGDGSEEWPPIEVSNVLSHRLQQHPRKIERAIDQLVAMSTTGMHGQGLIRPVAGHSTFLCLHTYTRTRAHTHARIMKSIVNCNIKNRKKTKEEKKREMQQNRKGDLRLHAEKV